MPRGHRRAARAGGERSEAAEEGREKRYLVLTMSWWPGGASRGHASAAATMFKALQEWAQPHRDGALQCYEITGRPRTSRDTRVALTPQGRRQWPGQRGREARALLHLPLLKRSVNSFVAQKHDKHLGKKLFKEIFSIFVVSLGLRTPLANARVLGQLRRFPAKKGPDSPSLKRNQRLFFYFLLKAKTFQATILQPKGFLLFVLLLMLCLRFHPGNRYFFSAFVLQMGENKLNLAQRRQKFWWGLARMWHPDPSGARAALRGAKRAEAAWRWDVLVQLHPRSPPRSQGQRNPRRARRAQHSPQPLIASNHCKALGTLRFSFPLHIWEEPSELALGFAILLGTLRSSLRSSFRSGCSMVPGACPTV